MYSLHQTGAFFVTRAKQNMNARRVYSALTDRRDGVICDQRIRLNGYYVAQDYPEHLRRIRFKDPASAKTLVFLTNHTTLSALTIAALYKSRWQIELFFKWIKQHLRIKRFFGTSENAVKTQIWCAIATYVLIAIVKHERRLDASLHTCLQVVSVSLFEKIELVGAVQPDRVPPSPLESAQQVLLFAPRRNYTSDATQTPQHTPISLGATRQCTLLQWCTHLTAYHASTSNRTPMNVTF